MTNATHNEVVLMSGSLGFSALVCLLNNGNNGQTETTANLLGPFWRMNSPATLNGGRSSARRRRVPAIFVNCTVKDQQGNPIVGAEVRRLAFLAGGFLRAAGPQAGAHEPARQVHRPTRTAASRFRSVKPAGYPIPTTARSAISCAPASRHNYRPAHLHFLIFKDGFKTLISQIYVNGRRQAGDRRAVRRHPALIGNYVRHEGSARPLT